MPTVKEFIQAALTAKSTGPKRPTLGQSLVIPAPAQPPDARKLLRETILGTGKKAVQGLQLVGNALDQRPRGVPREVSTSPARLMNVPFAAMAAGASGFADALTGQRTPVAIDPLGDAPQTSFTDVGQRLGGTPGAVAGFMADIVAPGPGELATMSRLGDLAPAMGALFSTGSRHLWAPEPGAPLGKFRADKIGAGEGAQIRGYGHYLAESPTTSNTYRTAGLVPAASPDRMYWSVGDRRLDAADMPDAIRQALRTFSDPELLPDWLVRSDRIGNRAWIPDNSAIRGLAGSVTMRPNKNTLVINPELRPAFEELFDSYNLLAQKYPELIEGMRADEHGRSANAISAAIYPNSDDYRDSYDRFSNDFQTMSILGRESKNLSRLARFYEHLVYPNDAVHPVGSLPDNVFTNAQAQKEFLALLDNLRVNIPPKFHGYHYKIEVPDSLIQKAIKQELPLKEQPQVLKALEQLVEQRRAELKDARLSPDYVLRPDYLGENILELFGAKDIEDRVYEPKLRWDKSMAMPLRPKEAAAWFQNAGIPGTSYPDRFAPRENKYRNLVVFPGHEDDLRVVERWEGPGPRFDIPKNQWNPK